MDAAVSKLGLSAVDEGEAQAVIAKIVDERADYVKANGKRAVGGLMGPVMGALRGKIDGKRANALLSAEIDRVLGQ
ncbi:hypothetical protein [Candidatus Methanomethylophilus sp. 1R26]|uniref:hypothetical protein n=1 Tax=Candidatus Methanomethylophilus sp. 1R26 TaxID=1769296 RepID=UPI002A4E2A90|nr:hypothetical protein [Candidatus Methanomethylophilus sp. 1R26]